MAEKQPLRLGLPPEPWTAGRGPGRLWPLLASVPVDPRPTGVWSSRLCALRGPAPTSHVSPSEGVVGISCFRECKRDASDFFFPERRKHLCLRFCCYFWKIVNILCLQSFSLSEDGARSAESARSPHRTAVPRHRWSRAPCSDRCATSVRLDDPALMSCG